MNIYIVLLNEDSEAEKFDEGFELITYAKVSEDEADQLTEARKNLLVRYGITPGTEGHIYYVDMDWKPKNKKVDVSKNIKKELTSLIREHKIREIE